MQYSIINPPINILNLSELEPRDPVAKGFFNWFLKEKDNRLKILENTVCSSKGLSNWKADFSIESFMALQKWFEGNVVTRKKTAKEIEHEKTKLKGIWHDVIEIQDWILTEQTYSICLDIGIFWGEYFIKEFPILKWSRDIRPRSAQKNHPVVISPNKVQFSVLGPPVVCALSIAKKERIDWKDLNQTWSEKFKTYG